jgi:hypothetical protein
VEYAQGCDSDKTPSRNCSLYRPVDTIHPVLLAGKFGIILTHSSNISKGREGHKFGYACVRPIDRLLQV